MADHLQALTLWRPWAGLVAAKVKPIENRDWPPPDRLIGKRLAIHAGKKWDREGALWALGAVPAVLRSDNLSAATHELKQSNGRDLTRRFRAVLDHYGLRSSRITPGRAHENKLICLAQVGSPRQNPPKLREML